MTLWAERERHTENVFHIFLMTTLRGYFVFKSSCKSLIGMGLAYERPKDHVKHYRVQER